MKTRLREVLDRLRPWARDARDRFRDRRRRIRKWVGARAKRLHGAAERWEVRAAPPLLLLAGWAAVTAGVAELFGAGRVVWPIGAGLLAWGLYGFRALWLTMWYGLAGLREMAEKQRRER